MIIRLVYLDGRISTLRHFYLHMAVQKYISHIKALCVIRILVYSVGGVQERMRTAISFVLRNKISDVGRSSASYRTHSKSKSLFYSLTVVIMITDVQIHSSRWYPPPSWSVWLSNEGIDWLKCSIMRTKARGDWLRHSCACDFILLLISCMSFVCGFIFFVSPTVEPRSLDEFENWYPLISLPFRSVFGKLLFEIICNVLIIKWHWKAE